MSMPSPSEHLERIRDDACRLAGRAGDHEDELERLVRAAETTVRQADAALSQALNAGRIDAGQMQQLCSAQLKHSLESAEAARQACVSAREQHVTACRLLTRIDAECAAEQQTTFRRRAPAVLVVDDVEEARELVALVLRDAGFVVRTAVNGLDALIAAYEMQPAVIVMDITMPVLDGVEATRLIKATEATRHARVIAHTATPPLSDALAQRLFVAVLPKPSTPDLVLATVRNVADL
jgi:two-component system, cell cycle response regulator DivK